MKYRKIPRADLEVSEIGFGVWTIATTWWGRIAEETRAALLENAVEQGINLFDTADVYGDGYGEEVLAKVLGHKRHELVWATKFGYDFYDKLTPRVGHQERPQKFTREFVRFACEQSLRRLRTDYIDIYQAHNIRLADLERDELFETLEDLKAEGKIRHYAVALGPDIGWFEEGEYAMRERKVGCLQIIYSILEQDPAKRFFPIAEEHDVALLSRVPHASEVLTGRYIAPPTFDESDHRAHRRAVWLSEALKKSEQVRFLAGPDTGRTMSQAAIQFCLYQPSIRSVLPNFTNLDELREYAAAPETPSLTAAEQAKLDELWENEFYLKEPARPFREV